jgi:hypothetical protein
MVTRELLYSSRFRNLSGLLQQLCRGGEYRWRTVCTQMGQNRKSGLLQQLFEGG